ncbi:hypothetical protein CE91St36_13710 [Christensenellaceae bacterium]|nr:hypothetical protein CE91St36_13710 [Christensenellaceae bacterium]BDF61222.1 hypothetical protein CE91St37_13720 [Christensenellaceae bacterium]
MEAAIRHMVVFSLKYPKDDPRTADFFKTAKRIFSNIPIAKNFMMCSEISPKNGYDYGFSFDFMTQADYDAYNQIPEHLAFIEERWNKEVSDFMEIDFKEQ